MDIVELVGEYVQLKKSGQGLVGLCPFHNEKGPSFHVQPMKQMFHCFGCNKGGNVFTFLTLIEALSFPEAVQRLARRTGVELREDSAFKKRSENPSFKNHSRLFEALELATKYFQYLLTEKKEYKYALDYILSRGITKKTLEKFRIGVSPTGWTTLMDFLLKRGFTFEELVSSGLVIEKEGSPKAGRDRFRERLMFPICNKEGQSIAFGARILNLSDDKQPKYINSSETPVFSKRRNLYGLFENQRGIRLRQEAIIVEGYMDVIGLYEAGVTNAVATMGTALTEEHCREIRSLTKNIVTVFDPDSAGIEAWHRSVHLCMESGLIAKDLSLPEKLDPDEFVLKEGADIFYQLCDKAPRQITKYLKEIASKGSLSPSETSKHLSDLTPILKAIKRLPDRAMLWDDISLVLKVSISALKQLGEDSIQQTTHGQPKPHFPLNNKPIPKIKLPEFDIVDLEFLKAVAAEPEAFLNLPKERWLGGVKDPVITDWLLKLSETKTKEIFESTLETLIHQEPDSVLAANATAGLFAGDGLVPKPLLLEAVTERVVKRKKELEIKALSTQVKLAERLGDEKEMLLLLERLKELRINPYNP